MELSITAKSHISEIDLSRKWRRFGSFSAFALERFACCALTIQYIICSMVGWSIADIYDRGGIFTEAQSAELNMLAEVRYRGYGPIYRARYNILYGECATGEPLPENASQNDTIFARSAYHRYETTSQCLSFCGCAITVLYYIIILHYILW